MIRVISSLGLGLCLIWGLLWFGLHHNPRALTIPSRLQVKHQVIYTLQDDHPHKISQDLKNHVTLLHVINSHCHTCQSTHGRWLSRQPASLQSWQLMALAFQDKPQAVSKWLQRLGNPYQQVIIDPEGQLAIDLGVTGTPELFLIDRQGRVQQHWIGPMGPTQWQQCLQAVAYWEKVV